MDVKDPIKTHINLQVREGNMSKANIKYEKLMNICFSCGQLGHGSKDCVNGYVDTKNLKFGVC